MPRIARIVATGYPHHITQRGNYKQKIFSVNADFEKYLSILKHEAAQHKLSLLAYCLMPNHVHFIAIPEKKDSIANVFKYTHMRYAQYYHKKMNVKGHLFQGRFFSSVMDEKYTIACARYIERNPVRAGLVSSPCLWKWSSAGVHCGIVNDDRFRVRELFSCIEYTEKEWEDFIKQPDRPGESDSIAEKTMKGRPLGDVSFIEELENKLGRVLKIKPRGRYTK